MEGQQHGDRLKRGLKNRHIQLIALGGAIGTGLFLGSASVIQSAGPGIILGYAIAGFIAFLIMRQLGEMVVEEPVAGSFSHFAYKYWGSFAGFASGWNYWVLVCPGGHGGTDRRWQIYPVLVAGNPYLGLGGGLLHRHQRH
ncbi:Aromatic amino acid transport protein AroP [Klebsiella pneumoniae]|uniref:Aromatic amino acid transport protein AroP n=1 Tax=Klebsiella pneumoniae TaxID=573 RepID=A0A447RZP8_KLEPN|nr:Aromatic amino acid transport protein AroP [Klebsiella pneumoniae]